MPQPNYLFSLHNVALFWNVDTVQELSDILVLNSGALLDPSSCWERITMVFIGIKNHLKMVINNFWKPFHQKLFKFNVLTRNQDIFEHLPDWETASMELPSTTNSSFCLGEAVMVTPVCMSTLRMYFWPKKLRISTDWLLLEMTQLMGKWAYTARILYWKPWKKQEFYQKFVWGTSKAWFFPTEVMTTEEVSVCNVWLQLWTICHWSKI